MAKVSPLIAAMNGGEWSPLVEGRVSHERYKTALKVSSNFAGIAQGPAVRRSGTRFVAPQLQHATPGRMIEFEFSVLDAFMIGFEDNRARFLKPDGPLVEPIKGVTALVTATASTVTLTVPSNFYAVNDEVFFGNFPVTTSLFQAFGIVTAVAGDTVTIGGVDPAGYSWGGGEYLARVFKVTTPYTAVKLASLRSVQSADTLYLYEPATRTQVLKRDATYTWPIRDYRFEDGPYLPINDTPTMLFPQQTGNAIAPLVGANAFDGGFDTAGHEGVHAFDGIELGWWVSNVNQQGFVGYDFGVQTPLRGYTIYGRTYSDVNGHAASDFNPSSWVVEGSLNGVDYFVIDKQIGHVLYTRKRTPFFKFKAEPSYRYYRLRVWECMGHGDAKPTVSELIFTPAQSQGSSFITFNATATTGINKGAGFLSTDVGRPMRFKGSDGFWRWYTITAINSPTSIAVRQESDALPDFTGTTEWRLGIFSDTTGWPTCGFFYEDRLVIGGKADIVAASSVGNYENHSPSDPDGVVTDANGWAAPLNGRKVGSVKWIEGDNRGLIVGTLNGPWAIRSTDVAKPLTAATAKAFQLPRRACADADPVAIDNELLFLPRSQRILRELSYDYNSDGYKARSVSLFATHLGKSKFKRLAYAAEPHSIIWTHREDGMLVGFTYNVDEEVFGWHQHPIGGNGLVTDIGVLSSPDASVDDLWVQVKRTIAGQTRYFYEILQPFCGETTTLDNSWFVDCGFLYEGAPKTVIGGLWRINGEVASILADGRKVSPQVVVNGTVTLSVAASRVVVGLGYDSYGETLEPEAGSADGTALGKTKRNHHTKLRLWKSLGGEIGPVGSLQELEYQQVGNEPGDRLELFDGTIGPVPFPDGYDDGRIAFRQSGDNPLPFNLVAIMPQLMTQDG